MKKSKSKLIVLGLILGMIFNITGCHSYEHSILSDLIVQQNMASIDLVNTFSINSESAVSSSSVTATTTTITYANNDTLDISENLRINSNIAELNVRYTSNNALTTKEIENIITKFLYNVDSYDWDDKTQKSLKDFEKNKEMCEFTLENDTEISLSQKDNVFNLYIKCIL